jgi:hypothetical protein
VKTLRFARFRRAALSAVAAALLLLLAAQPGRAEGGPQPLAAGKDAPLFETVETPDGVEQIEYLYSCAP